MTKFRTTLVSPEELIFSSEVDQVDLPGAEGDLGIMAGHSPMVIRLRPGIITVIVDGTRSRFVVLEGVAELSQTELTILADTANSVEDFDLGALKARIAEMEEKLPAISVDELDREVERLDRYRSIHVQLTSTTAF